MKGLSAAELVEIADSDPDEYTEEARALAWAELAGTDRVAPRIAGRRGGPLPPRSPAPLEGTAEGPPCVVRRGGLTAGGHSRTGTPSRRSSSGSHRCRCCSCPSPGRCPGSRSVPGADAITQRGHGDSDKPADGYAMTDFADFVDTLTDPLDPAFVHDFQASTVYSPVPAELPDRVVAESLKVPGRQGFSYDGVPARSGEAANLPRRVF